MDQPTHKGPSQPIQMLYRGGTLVFEGINPEVAQSLPMVTWDERTLQYRAPAHGYRQIFTELRQRGLPVDDQARRYGAIDFNAEFTPRPHQAEALTAWISKGQRGTVEMPTGAGKTILAMMIMANIKRSTLIVVPTIDLLQQWERVIQGCYGGPVGVLGGGQHDIQPVTVTTYDSAAIHIERLGDRFGLVIFDECHHLPAPQYQFIAQSALAPFRLGLSATVQRPDGKEAIVYNLVGPLVYEGKIREMSSNTLAPYEVITMPITMNPDEQEAYDAARKTYTSFIKSQGIRMDQRDGWIEFIKRSARSSDGRKAMKAYWVQKRLSQAAAAKVSKTWEILQRHRGQRILIFTDDNLMAYRIGREFLVPVLTHKTKLVERKRILACFRQGTQTVIATSKVLNEGVDVPEASIGVVLSGSGAVREHVQRLGRILRHQEGKTAILYELIAKGTGEHYVNQRRKQHDAYEGPAASATTRW